MGTDPDRATNHLLVELRRLLIRVLVVYFLVAPLVLLALGGAVGLVGYLAVSVIVLGLWYTVPPALKRSPEGAEQQSP